MGAFQLLALLPVLFGQRVDSLLKTLVACERGGKAGPGVTVPRPALRVVPVPGPRVGG